MSMSSNNTSKQSFAQSNKTAPTPSNFPTGQQAKRELRNLLLSANSDPSTVISTFQTTHSLHSFLAKGFSTTPLHECPSAKKVSAKQKKSGSVTTGNGVSSGGATTRGAVAVKDQEKRDGIVVEPFHPESVLTFLGHLGVSRYEMHKKISDALRSALEDEVGRVDMSQKGNHEILLNLLTSSWKFHSVAYLRPVIVALIRKLGDKTPVEVLTLLASKKKDGGGELNFGELVQGFGLKMKRLVWEADWNSVVRGDGTLNVARDHPSWDSSLGTLTASNLLADMVRPAVESYVMDEKLRQSADLTFVSSIREKRVATQHRRAIAPGNIVGGVPTSGGIGISSTTGTLSAFTSATSHSNSAGNVVNNSNSKSNIQGGEDGQEKSKPSSGIALAKLKEIIGSRPKLLGAVLNMLISEHGLHANNTAKSTTTTITVSQTSSHSNESILGGALYLTCSLAADILLSYGQLPRQYEHVGILAQVLDNCVKIGLVSDQAVAQIQGCLKAIFQPAQEKEKNSTSLPSSTSTSTSNVTSVGDSKTKDDDTESIATAATAKSSSSTQSSSTTSKKKTSFPMKKEDDKQYELKLLRKIVGAAATAMKEIDPQGLFRNPVTDQIAPGYSTLIKKPMCISVIETKSINQQYSSLSEYESDVLLMFHNCITYNVGKEGTWFRTEARRQQKVWRDEILKQAKGLYKTEMAKRKRALEKAKAAAAKESVAVASTVTNADIGTAKKNEKKRKREALLAQQEQIAKAASFGNKGAAIGKSNDSANGFNNDGPIDRLTAQDISPLPESRAKKRKKDTDFPSMPALASMLLSDPFVVRLLVDKVIRAMRKDVIDEKNIPSGHKTIPSVLQILHLSQFSTQLCAVKGKRFFIPDVGLAKTSMTDDDGGGFLSELSFPFLRKFTPLLTKLLLEVDLDRRMTVGGDLYDAAKDFLPSRPPADADVDEWEGSSQLWVLRAMLEGSLVNLLQPGNSNERALLIQYPRFIAAIDKVSGGDMRDERPFFVSLIQALIRHKSKLAHSTRDLVVRNWLKWFNAPDERGCMTCAVHEYLMQLLNEWASLGNLILPRDTFLSFSEDAAKAAEACEKDKNKSFSYYWARNEDAFSPIKVQYERMLKSIPAARALQWKESIGIDDSTLAAINDK